MRKDLEREFQHESLQDRDSILAYLKALADGISTGAITFTDKDGEISLTPGDLVSLEVRANKKRNRASLSVKLSWKDETEKQSGPERLTIRANNGRGDG